ncbi:hypothetical protein KP22_04170 [Pectobacterium betavasculorum]|uniref:Uncharacterized protein n=2 Tax=Pectobacterium betavasculorum TaxID=55207 RepID=A0A093RWS5_9GAMM|nr:hypothetical protein KP22_04170 [Pectobacterium betavasculorum]
MDNYFFVEGDNGRIQIDDNFKNLSLVKKVTIPANINWTEFNDRYYSDNALVAFRPSFQNGDSDPSSDNGYYAPEYRISNGILRINNYLWGAPPPMDFYIFDAADPPLEPDAGLAIFNAQGEPVYSTNNSYLRVVELRSDTLGYSIPATIPNPITAPVLVGEYSSKVAVAVVGEAHSASWAPGDRWDFHQVIKFIGNKIYAKYLFEESNSSAGSGSYEQNNFSLMIIKVD